MHTAILCGNLYGRDHLENGRREVNNGYSRNRMEDCVGFEMDCSDSGYRKIGGSPEKVMKYGVP